MPILKHSNRRQRNRVADQRRGSARERGYSTSWDKFARSYLIGNPLCIYCATQGRDSAAVLVDHIVPHKGDPAAFWPEPETDWAKFFAPCCKPCHDGQKQRAENYAEQTGKDVRDVLIKRKMLPKDFFAGGDDQQK